MPPSWLETGELLDSIHALKAFGRYDEAEQLWVRHVPEVAEIENSARVLHRFESFLSSSPTPMRAVHLSLPLDSPRRLASHARPRVLPRKPGTGAGVTHRRVPVHAPFIPRPLLASLAAPDLFSASLRMAPSLKASWPRPSGSAHPARARTIPSSFCRTAAELSYCPDLTVFEDASAAGMHGECLLWSGGLALAKCAPSSVCGKRLVHVCAKSRCKWGASSDVDVAQPQSRREPCVSIDSVCPSASLPCPFGPTLSCDCMCA
jgi:hypothetical protein